MTTAPRRTTAIGSLPHHNADAALEFSFSLGIPFLPQIPLRDPRELMIAQALDGLPGLRAGGDGAVGLDVDTWLARAARFEQKLARAVRASALGERGGVHATTNSAADAHKAWNQACVGARAGGASPVSAFKTAPETETAPASPADALEGFEPGPESSGCWQPFVWELEERAVTLAKIQIAGPMTAQWGLRLESEGKPVDGTRFRELHPELASQCVRLVLARAVAMTRRLRAAGARPLIYLDEPALYALPAATPAQLVALRELALVAGTLRKEGALVGLHCCSNTDWAAVLALPLDYLSIDTALSLGSLLEKGAELKAFAERGGKLSLGVIPTRAEAGATRVLDARALLDRLLTQFARAGEAWRGDPALVRRILQEALYTPACGLALQSVADAEQTLEALTQFEMYIEGLAL